MFMNLYSYIEFISLLDIPDCDASKNMYHLYLDILSNMNK